MINDSDNNNLMQFKRLRDVLLVLISVVILILLFIQTQSIDNTIHNQYSRDLRQLNELDAILNQNILKSRFELLTDYDPLVAELTKLNQVRSRLEQPPSFINQAGQAEMAQLLKVYDDSLNEKERLIEVFKSENSTLNNSLHYFPLLVTEWLDNTSQLEGEDELVIELNHFLQDILVYNLMANQDLTRKIEQHINTLEDNQQKISLSSANSEIDLGSVINHARIILEGKPQMDALIEEIVSLPTAKKGNELFNAYNRHYQAAVQSNNYYRLYLYLFSLFLLAYVSIYVIYGFRKSAIALQAAKEALQSALTNAQQAEEQYRSIFLNATAAIFQATTDPSGRYLSVNPALSNIYGYESCKQLLETLNNLQQQLYVDPDRRSTFIKLMEVQDEVSDFESQVYRKDGMVIWICENVRGVRDENGDLLHYEGVIQDVTERKRAQQLLAEYNSKLLKEVEARTTQLARAHDEIQALNEGLQIENVRLDAELDVTRQLQQMLLPTVTELQQIEGLELSAFVEAIDVPKEELYDLLLQDTQIKMGLGGSNNSLSNGVLILMTRSVARALLTSNEEEQIRFLSMFNRTLDQKIHDSQGQKISLALLNYLADGAVRSSIQYEPIMVVRQGGIMTLVDSYDLGFSPYENGKIASSVQLDPIEGIVLYTGGLTATENADAVAYTFEQLSLVLSRHWQESAEHIMQAVLEDLYDHIGEPKPLDNLTLVILKQKETSQIKDIVLYNNFTREIVLKE